MSTRSYICIENEDGTYTGSYCHHDGYLTHNGALLFDHYSSRERVEKLISLGDMSVLGIKINPDIDMKHNFEYPQMDVCIFYGRDRGEEHTASKTVKLEELDKDLWIEYTYVYTREGEWKMFEQGHFNEGLKSLASELDRTFYAYGIDRPTDEYGIYTEEIIERVKILNAKNQATISQEKSNEKNDDQNLNDDQK